MPVIETVEQLKALYGEPSDASLAKVAPVITPEYRRMIEVSPFAILATGGPEGLYCSPRGDQPRSGAMLVLVQVSSMKTRRAGSTSRCRAAHWARRRATSGRSCSAAISVFFYN